MPPDSISPSCQRKKRPSHVDFFALLKLSNVNPTLGTSDTGVGYSFLSSLNVFNLSIEFIIPGKMFLEREHLLGDGEMKFAES